FPVVTLSRSIRPGAENERQSESVTTAMDEKSQLKSINTRIFEWGQIGFLFLLLVLLLSVASELNIYLVGGAFVLLVGYHLWSVHWLRSNPVLSIGLISLHLGMYLLLCALVIWSSTTADEESVFWVVFLLPIVAAATRLSLTGTVVVAAISSLLYALLLP